MRKKLEGNGLWESSRMMLPEHKAAYVVHQGELSNKAQPLLDEQEVERMARIIAYSLQFQQAITLVTFHEGREREQCGIVTAIDQQLRRIRLQLGMEEEAWLDMRRMIGVSAAEATDLYD